MNKPLKSLVLAGTAVTAGIYLWKQLQDKPETNGRTFLEQYGPWAIVTGAARAEGLGYGFARQLAGRHVNLVLVDILADELHARAAELARDYHVRVKPVVLDLARADFMPELTAVTDGLAIGLLVCNHMFTPKETPTILEMDLATHHAMLDINARAYTTLVHGYGRQMVTQGHGGILLVSSQGGLHGTPYTGAYSANKAFQLMLGESLWYELRQSNVDVLVLTPGLTRTQGDALDDYPAFMLMDVEPVVREALANLGRQHLVIPGPVNKLFYFATTHLMSRQKAVVTTGDLMAQGAEQIAMQDWLAERAQATPHKLALILGEQRWNYGALNQMVNATCARLQDAGVQPGDFVAVLLPNGLPFVCLVHALARLGAILVPLNTRLTASELRWQLEHVGARWLLIDQIDPELSIVNCEQLIVNEAWLTPTHSFTIHHSQFTIHNYQSVVFTSGTSGQPKGVLLTFANHFWSATASAYRLGLDPNDLWLSVLPLYHVGGLAVLFRSCLYGTAVSLHPRFDLATINHDLDTNPITLISLVPTMLHRLLQSRTFWPSHLRLILLGGAAAPPELVQQANALPRSVNGEPFTDYRLPITDYRPPLVAPTYGLTEAASQVATLLPADAARKPGSVGRPLMFTSVKIVGEDGVERPSGEIGEIVVTGPTVMAGYFQEVVASGKWQVASAAEPATCTLHPATFDLQLATIHTGDLGYLDADGDLFLVQRRSDLIVTGGENVYPAEVEAVLRQYPQVVEACVVGIPDAEWGQRVVAMVQIAPNATVSAQDLITFCREHLAGYKIPRYIELVAELPLTASGKIGRKQVTEQLKTWLNNG